MKSGDRLSAEVLASEAIILTRLASKLLGIAETIAVRYPVSAGVILGRVRPGLDVCLANNIVSVALNQFGSDNSDNTRYLPELPKVIRLALSAPPLLNRKRLTALPLPAQEEIRSFHLNLGYQLAGAAAVAQYEVGEELTSNQGEVILASRTYRFHRNGELIKCVFLEGSGNFMNPDLLRKSLVTSTASFYREPLVIQAGDISLIGVAMRAINGRLSKID